MEVINEAMEPENHYVQQFIALADEYRAEIPSEAPQVAPVVDLPVAVKVEQHESDSATQHVSLPVRRPASSS
eukprot:1829225-Karenia_brevis.AAC.1